MTFEILFCDGTKLKLEGYKHEGEDEHCVTLIKEDKKEVVTVYKRSVSYFYAKTT